MIWVLNTNTNQCRLYAYHKKPAKLELIKEINHPENRMKKSEYLTSDKPGSYRASNSAQGTYTQDTDPKEVAIDDFAREIARDLNHGRTTHAYEKLIIITPPKMEGLIQHHLDKHVKALITNHIQKELIHLSEGELLTYLQKNAQFPD